MISRNIPSKIGIKHSKNLFHLSCIGKRYQSVIASTQTSNYINKPESYDIVICGGGLAGTAMARALGKSSVFKDLKIALIDPSIKSNNEYILPEIHANRVCALNDKTIELLKTLDCFDFILKNRYGVVKDMCAWDGSSDSFITFERDEANLSIIVERDLIQASLLNNLNKIENLKLISSQVKEIANTGDINLKLMDNTQLNAKLLIGADGINSLVRAKSNFKVSQWDYDQIAIVATLKLEQKQENKHFWQRFLSTGPIALYPLNDEYSSLVWSMKKSLAKEIISMNDDKFIEEINKSFTKDDFKNNFAAKIENNLHGFFDRMRNSKFIPKSKEYISKFEPHQIPPKIESCAPNSRDSYPLSFLHAQTYVKQRVALIGDAAHRIHPTSGQAVTFGFGLSVCDNLGFGDVQCLFEALRKNIVNGATIGSKYYLDIYGTKRIKEVWFRSMGIDFMNRLYSDYSYPIKTPIVAARTIGLTVSHRWLPLKNFYYKHALNKEINK